MASAFRPPYLPTYEGADDYLGNRSERRISGNTRLVRLASVDHGPNPIALRLHSTDIVTYYEDGRIEIATGGYETPTTKRYINGAAPCYVSQMNFQWYVNGEKWNGEPRNVSCSQPEVLAHV